MLYILAFWFSDKKDPNLIFSTSEFTFNIMKQHY